MQSKKNKFTNRIEKLISLFPANKIDGLFISKPEDVSYFTGTKGSDLFLWISESEQYLITDFRYREMAQAISWFSLFETNATTRIVDLLTDIKEKRIGVCKNSLPLSLYIEFLENLSEKEIVVTGDNEYSIINELRIIKDAEEIEYTKIAEEIGSDAFRHILKYIKPNMSEKQIALELEYYMLNHGADGLSFDTICIAGKKTSMPHGVPDESLIKTGNFLTMDYGCTYKGYHSDMTRTIAIGEVSTEMRNIYNIVLEAQINACKSIKAGLAGDICHNFAFKIIENAGFGEYFGHGLGHGTGLEIHEAPRLSPVYKKPIPVNSIVSIEPGIYLPGKFGVRIEDLAVIQENGIINLTSAPKELIII